MTGRFPIAAIMIACSASWRCGHECSGSDLTGRVGSTALPAIAAADRSGAVWAFGRRGDEAAVWAGALSGSVAGGGTGRARAQRDCAAHLRSQAAACEDARGVRLQPGATYLSGTDSSAGRRWLYPESGTAGVRRRAWYRQDASGDWVVCGGLPATAACALYHRYGSGERSGGSQTWQSTEPCAGPLVAL